MKKYDVLIADPAGNITAIVLNKDIEKSDYISIAGKLMNIKKYGIEQVGFVRDPEIGGAPRLEMMGGEFCGNATRSFGLYVAADKYKVGEHVVKVEISGSSHALEVETNIESGFARTSMPIPKKVDKIDLNSKFSLTVIVFEGIVHVIVLNEESNYELFKKVKPAVMDKYDPEAFGLIFLDAAAQKVTPIVHVKKTGSVVYENSCGSGTVAAAIYLSENLMNGTYTCNISNPGGIIESEIHKSEGKVTKAFIGGKVKLSQIKHLMI